MLTSALIRLIAMVLHRNSHAKAIGYGHDKGAVYIKKSSELVCRVFKRSPVFRIGGDKFAAVLRNADYQNRKALTALFEKIADELRPTAENKWEQVRVALGMAEYDPPPILPLMMLSIVQIKRHTEISVRVKREISLDKTRSKLHSICPRKRIRRDRQVLTIHAKDTIDEILRLFYNIWVKSGL